MADNVHELTAAYALDALDAPESHEYEEHLRNCPACRDELRDFSEASTALAYAVPAPVPPAALRDRILDDVRRERSNVIPFRARRPFWTATGLAAAAACAAIGLGFWASSLQDSLDEERRARVEQEAAIALVSDPSATRAPLSGGNGTLVVGRDRSGVLILSGVGEAPEGKDYEAWVASGPADPGPEPAGLFDGGSEKLVLLTSRVPEGSIVMVTLEDEGGVPVPKGELLFRSSA